MEILSILGAGFFVMMASLSGVFFINRYFKSVFEKKMSYLLSFSAGVFLISSYFLAVESTHLLSAYSLSGILVLAGFVLAWGLTKLMPEIHHHHDKCCDGHKKDRGARILIGDGIHSMADGLVIVSAFLVSPALGVGMTLSIFVHEFLQEIGEFFILKSAGYSTARALVYNFAVSSMILVGVLLGLFMMETEFTQGVILAMSAGFFLYIVSKDLLPHNHGVESAKSMGKHLLVLLTGLVLMFGVNTMFEHSHDADVHEHEDEKHEGEYIHNHDHGHEHEGHDKHKEKY